MRNLEVNGTVYASLYPLSKTCSMEELSFMDSGLSRRLDTDVFSKPRLVLLRNLLEERLDSGRAKAIIHNSNDAPFFSVKWRRLMFLGFRRVAKYEGNSGTVYTYIKTK